ncbi:hypothetical protein GCM10010417_38030 [Streptomyces carpaticus]
MRPPPSVPAGFRPWPSCARGEGRATGPPRSPWVLPGHPPCRPAAPPLARLGTCDDAGFAPFADDTATSQDVAFAKIAARVQGTALAAEALGA